MKTIKALKITSALQIIFCLFCIAATICFGICRYADSSQAFQIANILTYGWIVNPIGPVSFIICGAFFLIERKQPEHRQLIGKNWVWIIVWPVITTVFYFAASILMVAFTGGV